jgi:hypothetical protein
MGIAVGTVGDETYYVPLFILVAVIVTFLEVAG